jgi:hypothetical protein
MLTVKTVSLFTCSGYCRSVIRSEYLPNVALNLYCCANQLGSDMLQEDSGMKMTVFWDVAPCSVWNVLQFLRDYTEQNPRRQSSSYSAPWEPGISQDSGSFRILLANVNSVFYRVDVLNRTWIMLVCRIGTLTLSIPPQVGSSRLQETKPDTRFTKWDKLTGVSTVYRHMSAEVHFSVFSIMIICVDEHWYATALYSFRFLLPLYLFVKSQQENFRLWQIQCTVNTLHS